ncbi:hypothetical protein RB6990 [Rhodopirellula baltica SH 1]|uniref:Uncharacterized protein n=1 Tax=Rhodopirellula baltica (strain DSM 10527 / NCIMB 13988 / SH1) TaxID=243090 RepID=Q7UPE7_RHOBA|nr:hypothetical protein RB6990 [Rhodopirellula baltica SH 1]
MEELLCGTAIATKIGSATRQLTLVTDGARSRRRVSVVACPGSSRWGPPSYRLERSPSCRRRRLSVGMNKSHRSKRRSSQQVRDDESRCCWNFAKAP